jgi:hypothetical protein
LVLGVKSYLLSAPSLKEPIEDFGKDPKQKGGYIYVKEK